MVARISRINCCFTVCNIFPMGMVDAYSSFPDNILCEGPGYYVSYSQLLIFK
jgi:hypothetical protein